MNDLSLPLSSPPNKLLARGKVRDVYEVDDAHLLLWTSDRVSAFDTVFAESVDDKAAVLNLLSAWWFRRTTHIIPNHLVETRAEVIAGPGAWAEGARGRVALVRRAVPVRFECVVRGYLDGSAWKEYEASGAVHGNALPAGLQRYDKLPEPLFTPSTKPETGKDLPVTEAEVAAVLGEDLAGRLRDRALALYTFAAADVAERGLTLLDTKFEFGHDAETGELLLIDEALTPDSSRYRPADPKLALPLDKQFLRDALIERGFQGDGPLPALDAELREELSRRYREVFQWITGQSLAEALVEEG